MKNKWIGITTVVTITILGLTSWFLLRKQIGQMDKLIIADGNQPAFALLYIAEANDYYALEGLDVEYREFILGRDAVADLAAGNADIAVSYEAPIVRGVLEGKPLKILGTLHRSFKSQAIVSDSSRGIKRIEDLRGKRIGISLNTSSEYFVYSLLLNKGISLQEVTIVPVEPQDLMVAYKNNEIDAVALWNPYLYRLVEDLNPNTRQVFYSEAYREKSFVVTRDEVIRNKPEALRRLMKALVRAEEYVHLHPNESQQIVANSIEAAPLELVRTTWEDSEYTLRLDNRTLMLIELEAKWFQENGFQKERDPNMREIFHTDLLKEVKPEAVTLY